MFTLEKVGIIEYAPTHIHLVYRKGDEWREECFILEPGKNYVCTARGAVIDGKLVYPDLVDEWRYVDDAERYVDNFARRVAIARERGILPASWYWIQRHIKL